MSSPPTSLTADPDWLRARLHAARFPRSATYDPAWMVDGAMGPNALWLLEWLMERITLPERARVLDLGCGRALTSVFLAREYGASVVAADLWIKPGDNWARIVAAGCDASVLPLHAEAHDLKFAPGYFDAIISVDAYQYFGTDDLYVEYLARFLRPGGTLGIVVPGLVDEFDEVPEHLRGDWPWHFACLHSAAWWRRLLMRTGAVELEVAERDPEGWRHWLDWDEVCARISESPQIRELAVRTAAMNRADQGRTLTFCRAVGHRVERAPAH